MAATQLSEVGLTWKRAIICEGGPGISIFALICQSSDARCLKSGQRVDQAAVSVT
jgi:hypothetical protein